MLAQLVALALVLSAPQRTWSEIAVVDGDPVMRGLPRDAIPAIDRPVFTRGADAKTMSGDELVIGITDGTTAKAYSTWHLNGHEIVNDVLGTSPIAVTWCPLCFTGVVYSRQVGGRTLRFGVSGMLWRENLVMYDRETDSWWAQAAGVSIQGPLKGRTLTQLPATMMPWREWLKQHPETLVLSKASPRGPEGMTDVYDTYHGSGSLGATGRMRSSKGVDPKARIAGFRLAGGAFAVDLAALAKTPVVIAEAGGQPVVLAADSRVNARVFRAGDHAFSIRREGGERRLIDAATGSVWDPITGRALSGTLQGARLQEIPANLSYWFAWRAFFPDTTWLVK